MVGFFGQPWRCTHVIVELRKLKQEHLEFKASLGKWQDHLKKKKNNGLAT
jgi:hypothetical protein